MASTTVNSSTQAIYDSINGSKTTKTTTTMDDAQNRFLTLLTTQLKNQDPLNPMDNAQVTSQMAQISTVDGIERLNSTLKTLLGDYDTTQKLQAAGLVGSYVLVPGSNLVLSNSAAGGAFSLESSADKVTVQIKNTNGAVVRTIELGKAEAGVGTFTWDGKNDAGEALTDGTYQIAVTAKKGTTDVKATKLQLGLVGGVTTAGGTLSLNVNGLGKFALSDVYQIL
jgi:flagellar basal-body rod modification protein FlgD